MEKFICNTFEMIEFEIIAATFTPKRSQNLKCIDP
jgi:hypothetical protein